MALKLVATRRARRDLLAYISADNPAAARSMQDRIDKALRLLTVRPFIGPAAALRDPSLRRFSVPPYIIFYKPKAETLAVVRVLHSSIDLSRQHIADDGLAES
jgi:plasmid stabilization system protein ParE